MHRKVAPLSATPQLEDAWVSYTRAASQLARQGFVDQAIGITRSVRPHAEGPPAVARARRPRGRAQAAGRRRERARRRRASPALAEDAAAGAGPAATRARKIQPAAFEPSYELANLLVRAGARDRALEASARHRAEGAAAGSSAACAVACSSSSPTPTNLWRWIASNLSR
jgi:hypothetical protein